LRGKAPFPVNGRLLNRQSGSQAKIHARLNLEVAIEISLTGPKCNTGKRSAV
jgi:hypothetical protein